ncbi:MAG: hypothetical protein ACYS8W_16060 [Planctomycetota bacterium]|jgi:hypothetical protein
MKTARLRSLSLILFSITLSIVPAGCSSSDSEEEIVFRKLPLPEIWIPDDYPENTDRWFIDFDDAALMQAMPVMRISLEIDMDFKARTIRYIRKYYNGLRISFCTEPPEGGSSPPPGYGLPLFQLGQTPYNTIAVMNGVDTSVLGRALLDTYSNGFVENNSGFYSPTGHKLGVFIDMFAKYTPASGDFDGCAKWLASLIAHEIGHSLGMRHDNTCSNIMNVTCAFGNYEPAFTPGQYLYLQAVLPGPGR